MAGADSPDPLRLLVVDDESLARLRLRRLVEEMTEPRALVVAEADTAAAAQAVLRGAPGSGGIAGPGAGREGAGHIDAVLLDIGLPGPSGLAFAATLRGLPQPPAVVFVTAHAGHALQAFDLQALDYLTKPVRRERLQQALARVAQWVGARGALPSAAPAAAPEVPVLVLNGRDRVLRLPHHEILSLRAEHKAVVVRTADQQYVVDESLNELEQRLGPGFLRVHRNALVALGAIRALALRPGLEEEGGDGWAVRVGGAAGTADEWLAVSRRQVASVKAALAGDALRS